MNMCYSLVQYFSFLTVSGFCNLLSGRENTTGNYYKTTCEIITALFGQVIIN